MSSSHGQNYDSSFEQVLHKRSDLHILRKMWHIATGSMALYIFINSGQDTEFWAMFTFLIAVAGVIFDFIRTKNRRINNIVLKIIGPLMRRSEREGMTGLPFYALGASLALFFFSRDIATLAIMFLVYADPISSFFGVLYGKDRILPNKSLQGAVAGFFTCYLITLFYVINTSSIGTHILVFSVIAGLIGSLSELVSALNIDDNLTIPVLSGLGLTVLNHFIHVFP